MVVLIVILGSLKTVVQRRRVPWTLPVYCVEVLFFWLLAGQRLADFVPFVVNGLEMAGGYSSAMQFPGPVLATVVFVAVAVGTVVLVDQRQRRLEKWYALFPSISLAIVFWLLAKASLVRSDGGHLLMAAAATPSLCLAVGALVWPSLSGRRPKLEVVTLVAVALALPAIMLPSGTSWYSGIVSHVIAHRGQQLASFRQAVEQGGPSRKAFDESDAVVRQDYPIPQVDGTMDVYPSLLGMLIANKARAATRPVIQSYCAYTPRLAQLNVEHLRGRSAPDYVLFSVGPLDCRFPTLDDGPSWLELLTRYDIDPRPLPPARADFLILKRSSQPRTYTLEPISSAVSPIRKPINVPPANKGPIWVEIDLHPSLLGRICAAALKTHRVHLKCLQRDGTFTRFVMPPEMGRSGFWLSPVVRDAPTLSGLAATRWDEPAARRLWARQGVKNITIDTPNRRLFQTPVEVRFFRLKFPPLASELATLGPRQLSLWQLKAQPLPCDAMSFCWIHGRGTALTCKGETRAEIPLGVDNDYFVPLKTARRLRVQYGGLVLGGTEGQTATFRISSLDDRRDAKPLWTKTITAGPRGRCTSILEETIPVDLAAVTALQFETSQAKDGPRFLPFWFGVEAN
jgi:hypothetical protein